MAYIVKNDETSNFKSFLVSGDDPNLMAPPPNSFSFVRRNLLSEIHRSGSIALGPGLSL
jgi:hypothetical protein